MKFAAVICAITLSASAYAASPVADAAMKGDKAAK